MAGAGRLSVDFHNHLMPGVDDGARQFADVREGLAALQNAGVRDIVASVHLDASLAERPDDWSLRLAEVDGGWEQLRSLAAAEYPTLRLARGAEVKLDTPNPDLSDPRLRLAGGRFVLVEFPAFQVPMFGLRMIQSVRAGGWLPILAHPERYRGATKIVETAREWTLSGAWLQLNHGSLNGRYGRDIRSSAAALLEAGLISYIASDYHARHRTWIGETTEAILAEPSGEEVIGALELNARRLLDEEPPLPVPPLRARRGLLDRLRDLLGGG